MISGSYESAGGILKNVQVMGLRCPCRYSRDDGDEDDNDDHDSECEVCIRACRSFPIDQVINFDNLGSSVGVERVFSCKRTHCLDVCLSRSMIENIVEERPGGKDILHSNTRLLHLLGRGSLSEICSDDGRSLLIVRYTSKEKEELKRVIKYSESNVDLMSSDEVEMSNEDVTRAIWQSFAKGEGCKVPPKDRCYLSRSSLNFLTSSNELGLIMDRKEFGLEAANIRNMTQIVKGLMIGNPVTSCCLSLLKNLLNNLGEEASITIQKVVDLGVVPALVRLLEHNKQSVQSDASSVLSEITLKGSDSIYNTNRYTT